MKTMHLFELLVQLMLLNVIVLFYLKSFFGMFRLIIKNQNCKLHTILLENNSK